MREPIKTEGHKDTEIAYLAGLFDGEGCIQIAKPGRTGGGGYSLKIIISMLHRKTVFEVYKCFGGHFNPDARKSGQVYSIWNCAGEEAGEILKLIIPYLIEKKEQAELGLDYLEEFGCHKRKHFQYRRTEEEKVLQENYRQMMQLLKVKNKFNVEEADNA